jgi:multisubunit Na+/H+ antiporter MnhC subunit
MDSTLIFYVAAVGLILIGIAGIVLSAHLVRIIFGIVILEAGANLLLLLAMVLTAIVIGVGILALTLSLALRVHRAYGTLDLREIRQHMEQDIADAAGIDMPTSSEAPAPVYASGEGRS